MSILNVTCSQEKAFVCVDTLGEAIEPGKGRSLACQKMFPVVHVNGIIAGRGLGSAVMATAMLCGEAGSDVDEIAERIPSIMFQASDMAEAAHRVKRIPLKSLAKLGASGFTIRFVGYSRKEGRMVCFAYDRTFDSMSVQRRQLDGCIGPWVDSWGEVPHPKTVEELEAVARLQLQLHRRDHPQSILGGKLIAAELTRDSMRIWQVCDLEAGSV